VITTRRGAALVGLCIAVSAAHLWFAKQWQLHSQLGEGAAASSLRRIEVAFVRELAPAAPAPAPAVVARRAARPAALPAAPAASAPADPPPAAIVEPAPPPAAIEPVIDASPRAAAATPIDRAVEPAVETVAALLPPLPPASAPPTAAAGGFDWPPSTRLSYTLTGDYRGPVDGAAQVEWLRSGNRYQVHLDVRIGAAFAPLVTRRMSSEGELVESGLRPLRYEEETKVLLRDARRAAVRFEPDRIVLAGGRDSPTEPGVQDTASQFVQLTWLFTTQPERLRVGQTLEMPLALPRRVDRWIYDVVAEELLHTPAGAIPTFYIKPRREAKAGGDLVVETWYAPSLQYLPVRIRIRQDEHTYVDLMLDRLPQQGSAPR
jgi:Protein of unknown function (DUF3108)